MTGAATPMRSHVTDVTWPAMPSAHGAQVLSLLYQFEQTQWWSTERLLEHQLRQLRQLLRHAAATVPFYRERLSAAGFDAKQPLTPDAFRALPLLTRREVQRAGAAMYCTALPAPFGRVGEGRTSGSTGEPLTVRRSEINQLFWEANTLRDHHWHRRDFSGKLAMIRTGSEAANRPGGLHMRSWGRPAAEFYKTGPLVQLSASTELVEQAQWILQQDPDYLMVYPSLLRGLLAWFAMHGERPARLREVRSVGETVDATLREACRNVLGVPLVDIYSAEEMGYIALQCPMSGAYHVMSESVIVEIIGDSGKPCAPGEMGQVVATSLHNAAMPMVRYVVGDYAEAGAPCACGRGLPVIASVIGKLRNLITLPDGRRFRPIFVKDIAAYPMIRQYQMIQHTLHDIEARLVVDEPLTEQTEERLRAMLQKAAGYPFHFSLVYFSGELPRGPRGKFEDFISRLPV